VRDGVIYWVTERVTTVKAGTLFDGKSDLAKLSSGQTDKMQKVAIGRRSALRCGPP